ncbi:lycopene cyclase family protein [Nocardia takedensis]|uniref:lycopene cyclase family protein n=1 Tax=Nocardia takedensis TaxID=259390 RepID=UPI0002D2D79D|nr:lycopene cyclase family protein [Nocardia takedensis]
MHTDVVICGGGPAGRALAHRCLVRGRSVTLVDPAPHRHWVATYAAWADTLPDWLDAGVVAAAVERPVVVALRRHEIDRRYVVLDVERLRLSLDIDGARVVADRATALDRHTVTCASGRMLTGDLVLDARGLTRSPARAEQTAYGLVVGPVQAAEVEPCFMDWRADNGADPAAAPSFLYAVPTGAGSMLLEETCLAGRPALDLAELRRRLLHRLRARGIAVTGAEAVERVRFPVEGGRVGARRFGAAGGFTHPATGYSVAASLSAADAIAEGRSLPIARLRAVAALRAAGLRALLALSPAEVPAFFEGFFALAPDRQRAYLDGRADPRGTAAAMTAMFTGLPPRLRTHVVRASLGM